MLSTGTKLGPYEIVAPLGAGGMGEVYRTRDTRLGRDIAIKIVPESFASDPDRLRRFEPEAQAVAALSDPNILAIHDVGEAGGAYYLVSELLDGESLHSKIAAGGLGTRRARQGIVHRDLKPENVFVTREGRVKILDFGLTRQSASTIAAATDATRASPVQTVSGLVLGTVSYMAPSRPVGR